MASSCWVVMSRASVRISASAEGIDDEVEAVAGVVVLSELQVHRANRSPGWCALHLRKARGTIMVHSLDALR